MAPDDIPSRVSSAAGGEVPTYPDKGFRIGEYLIKDTLGHGSMATVFLAEDGTGHDVAIKIFQEGPGVSPTMLERFRREAEATKKLRRHPHIMKVYATGKHGLWHYIVMEPIRNSRTLEDALSSSPMSIAEIVQLMVKIARALHYAHERHIVHRDVKPANIMIDEFNEPRLSDFGVAELADMPDVTVTGALTGTPLYMSPEQARAERAGPTSDIYSLGIVLYEALTGRMPYSTQHTSPVRNVLDAVRTELPKRPRAHRKDISRALEAVILKAIDKNPARRYTDAGKFADDLESAISGRRVTARLFSYGEHFIHLARRYDQFFAAAIVMLLMAGTAGWFLYQQLVRERYNKLLIDLHLRTFAARMAQNRVGEQAPTSPNGWNELRLATRAMSEGDLTAAREKLKEALELCAQTGDQRMRATVVLNQARCESLAADFRSAEQLYRDVLQNPDAAATAVETAQLEALTILLLQGDRRRAMEIVNLRELPASGPQLDILRCLTGELPPDKLVNLTPAMPARFRNEAYLAAAARYRLDNNEKEFANLLKRCLQASSPAGEWPGPLAKNLRGLIK